MKFRWTRRRHEVCEDTRGLTMIYLRGPSESGLQSRVLALCKHTVLSMRTVFDACWHGLEFILSYFSGTWRNLQS